MRFTEISLFGVYVAPMAVMLIAAGFLTAGLRLVVSHFGWSRPVWHPALFVFAVYVIALSSMVLIVAR
jgi:protein AaeX